MRSRRIGSFHFPVSLIDRSPADVLKFFSNKIVVRAERHWGGYMDYHVLCTDFDEVPDFEYPPEYQLLHRITDSGVEISLKRKE